MKDQGLLKSPGNGNEHGVNGVMHVKFAFSALAAVVAGGLLLAMPLPVAAQQAGQTMDKAPAPVTPFGPRVKPPRLAPGEKMPAAPARQAAPAVPKPEVVETHGVWRVVCEKVPLPGKGKARKTCYLSGTAVNPKRKGVFISMIVLKVKGKNGKLAGHMVNLRAPLGVFLPTGIAMEIDGKPVARAPFTRCNPLFCESTSAARKETLTRLKKGKKAKFIVYAAPGVGLPVEMKLSGFSAALKKMQQLP